MRCPGRPTTLRYLPILALVLATLPALWSARAADEFSSGDKLRTLYSNHFGFTDDGFPQVTIEIMGGQREVRLGATSGLELLPDGDGGSRIRGPADWTISLENGRPAKVREWIVVAHFPAGDGLDAEVELAKWRKKGHSVESFEVGTIFAVQGEVLDTRETLIAIDPVGKGKGLAKARQLTETLGIDATIHTELVRRPSGTIVARSGTVEVRNASVLWFANRNAKGTIAVKDVEVGGSGSQLKTRRTDRKYFGAVYITVGSDGKLAVVNAVAADDLLNGLVPSEMFPDAPMEALRAQAIAARTELLQKLGARHFGDPFLLCASQHCQVYSGAGHEHPRTNKAVHLTRGQVMIDTEKNLVDARYSATCGGHSEHNDVVWGGEADPVLRGRLDGPKNATFKNGVTDKNLRSFLDSQKESYCAKTKYSKGRYRWKVKVSAESLSTRIAKQHPGVGRLHALKPLKRGISGRISKLRLVGSKGETTVEGELVIRRLLGGLRSSLFRTVITGPKNRPEHFEFHGAGFGHGVGMCQVGAIGMATQGKTVGTILGHYYKNVSLRRLY